MSLLPGPVTWAQAVRHARSDDGSRLASDAAEEGLLETSSSTWVASTGGSVGRSPLPPDPPSDRPMFVASDTCTTGYCCSASQVSSIRSAESERRTSRGGLSLLAKLNPC